MAGHRAGGDTPGYGSTGCASARPPPEDGVSANERRHGSRRLVFASGILLAAFVGIAAIAVTDNVLGSPDDLSSVPVLLSNMQDFSKIANEATDAMIASDEHAARTTALLSDLKPVVNPLPNWKWNVFDPGDKDPPHHRWTARRLREEAKRLILLVNEAKKYEDDKYLREVHTSSDTRSYLQEALENVSKVEKESNAHAEVIYRGLQEAEQGISSAIGTSKDLVSVMDKAEDKHKRKVWEILEEHRGKLDYNKLLQEQYDLVEKAHIYKDEDLDEVKMDRYDSDIAATANRVRGWIQGMRGRIDGNMSIFKQKSIEDVQNLGNATADEERDMTQAYRNAMQLRMHTLNVANESSRWAGVIDRNYQESTLQHQNISGQLTQADAITKGVDQIQAVLAEREHADEVEIEKLETVFNGIKGRLATLTSALAAVQSAMAEEQAAHSALVLEEEQKMQRFQEAVATMEPQISSILDLSTTVTDLEAESSKNIGTTNSHLANVEAAHDKTDLAERTLIDDIAYLKKAIDEQQAFANDNSTKTDYDDLESAAMSVNSKIELVQVLSVKVDALKSILTISSQNLTKQIDDLNEGRKKWRSEAKLSHKELMAEADKLIKEEQTDIAATQSALKQLAQRIKAAKEWKVHINEVHVQLRQQLSETTQSLVVLDKKFSDNYAALEEKIANMQTQTEQLAEPDQMKVASDKVDTRAQQSLDSVKDVKADADHVTAARNDETAKLDHVEARLKATRKDIREALRKANRMLKRHPNLFERISCVCYDGDVLNGRCIAGSLADESTCDICPEGSWCVQGKARPCRTTCPRGQVLKGQCPAGSVSDVTTCEPSPEGFYSVEGKALPCRTTCDPGDELRGSCPAGSDHDSTRCAHCPAGFFCQDGKAHECKTSCDDGLVLTGKCKRQEKEDTTTCETSPSGFYGSGGAAIPCKSTCPDGQLLIDECPPGSTLDTSQCIACPDGHYCKAGKAFECKSTCADGEELHGQCPAGSSEDVTVCSRCPEEHFCTNGKAFECKKTCPDGQELAGRCRKGSTEDTTVCKPCKADFFCINGVSAPCKQDCESGLVLEGKCEAGSARDTTICKPCPENHFCDGLRVTSCKDRCWEGKILTGKCGEGSSSDTTTCEKCPANYYCKRGIAYECKSQCADGTLLEGVCKEGSVDDVTHCVPCPAKNFCKGGKIEPCKTTCPEGQLLQGFCRAGSANDQTECVPCPEGSFCVDGKAQECVKSCPNGQKLTGTCDEGSSTAITKCETCSAGSFCRGGKEKACKTTCPAGNYLDGVCEEGSSRDKTKCKRCPRDSFCTDGQVAPCKETCAPGEQLNGHCEEGSELDTTKCDTCPAGSYCTDGLLFPCKSTCPLGQELIGECAAGSESDVTECKPCPAGHFCRDGVATECRQSCPDGQKIEAECAEGSFVNAQCKPCRAGVFCADGGETACRASCEPGFVLEGFCPAGSSSDVTTCTAAPEGSYAVNGIATLCRTMCPKGQVLAGTCPAGSTEDTVSCIPCPEGSWCEDGVATPCLSECPNGQLLSGTCAEGSHSDTVTCEPCPAGNFCADGQVTACKNACDDGKFLEGECAVGAAEDMTHCTLCPAGVFCTGGEQTPCATTCPDGQELVGFCSAGSIKDTTSCEPCPSGNFCKNGVKFLCKTSCDDGELFEGECPVGSAADATTCSECPEGFFCQEGLKRECKKTCPEGTTLGGTCIAGSVTDTVVCKYEGTPRPLVVDWFKDRTDAEAVEEQLLGAGSDILGAETRLTCPSCGAGHIVGRKKLPLVGAKWLVQFYAAWPAYDSKQSTSLPLNTFPKQGFGEQKEDTITATMNGVVINMPRPQNLGKMAYFTHEFEGEELAYRFDFTSQTSEVHARPFIVSGEITLLRDATTGDEGSGAGPSSGGSIKGYALNAIDGKKVRKGSKFNDGLDKDPMKLGEDPKLLLFEDSRLVAQLPVVGGKVKEKVADGKYTCLATVPGAYAFYDPMCHVQGAKMQKNIIFSPIVNPGQMRIVLTWGPLIKDMDAYMLVPPRDVTDPPCETNWKNKICHAGLVHLDEDNKSGFGPETITIESLREGRYRFRVGEYHGFDDNRERLGKSEAQVVIYTAAGIQIFDAGKAGSESEPTSSGFLKGESWYVFTVDGSTGKVYPCDGDACGHGFHHLNNRGR